MMSGTLSGVPDADWLCDTESVRVFEAQQYALPFKQSAVRAGAETQEESENQECDRGR